MTRRDATGRAEPAATRALWRALPWGLAVAAALRGRLGALGPERARDARA